MADVQPGDLVQIKNLIMPDPAHFSTYMILSIIERSPYLLTINMWSLKDKRLEYSLVWHREETVSLIVRL